jgi:hypothetical protein
MAEKFLMHQFAFYASTPLFFKRTTVVKHVLVDAILLSFQRDQLGRRLK